MTDKNDVFVGNLTFNTTEEQLREIFEFVGPVKNIRILTDRDTGRPKGFAFIEYFDANTALAAIRHLDGRELNKRVLRVSYSNNSNLKEIAKSIGQTVPDSYQSHIIIGRQQEMHAVTSLQLHEAWDILDSMKRLIEEDKSRARALLEAYPQLVGALIEIQKRLGMIPSMSNQSYSANTSFSSMVPGGGGTSLGGSESPALLGAILGGGGGGSSAPRGMSFDSRGDPATDVPSGSLVGGGDFNLSDRDRTSPRDFPMHGGGRPGGYGGGSAGSSVRGDDIDYIHPQHAMQMSEDEIMRLPHEQRIRVLATRDNIIAERRAAAGVAPGGGGGGGGYGPPPRGIGGGFDGRGGGGQPQQQFVGGRSFDDPRDLPRDLANFRR